MCAGSINSEGLPNPGIEYLISKDVLMAIHGESGKPYIISLSGLKLADNLEMLSQVAAASKEFPGTIAAVELNLACPNIPGMPCLLLPHCDWACAQASQQWR